MNRLTPDERRRVYLAQQRARESMLARLNATTMSTIDPYADGRGRRRMLEVVVIAAMLGGGLLLAQTLEFNPPASLIEALLPRL
ncbi:MAG: hypothetical protein ACREKS_21340 [Candidatus Rokuibacteriota bacterium]